MRNLVYVFVVVLAISICAAPGIAATNLIANPSFETPALGGGVWQAPNDWNGKVAGTIYWNLHVPAADGTQSVLLWDAMWQDTGVQFQGGYTYTFSVYTSTWHDGSGAFWWGIGDPYVNGGVNNWYGGPEVVYMSGSDPNWYKHTASRTVPVGDPMVGKNIVFQLGSDYGGGLDLIELYATPPIPEPSALLALGSGLVGVMGLAFRRRRQ